MPKVEPRASRSGAPALGRTSAPEPSISGWREASATTAKIAAAGASMTRSTLTTVADMVRPPSRWIPAPRLDGVGDQVAQLHPFERRRMRRCQDDRGRHARLEGLLPARGAQAPLVPGSQ